MVVEEETDGMPEKLNVEEIIARNPNINQEMLERVMELEAAMRAIGVQRKSYDIMPPFRRRPVPTQQKVSPRQIRYSPLP